MCLRAAFRRATLAKSTHTHTSTLSSVRAPLADTRIACVCGVFCCLYSALFPPHTRRLNFLPRTTHTLEQHRRKEVRNEIIAHAAHIDRTRTFWHAPASILCVAAAAAAVNAGRRAAPVRCCAIVHRSTQHPEPEQQLSTRIKCDCYSQYKYICLPKHPPQQHRGGGCCCACVRASTPAAMCRS